jgi:glycogen debranching enzyme
MARVRGLVACLIAGASVLSAGRAAPAGQAEPPDAPRVERFTIERSPLTLTGDVRPHQYVGVIGRKAAWLGTETGEAEVWVHPLKLASDLQLSFLIPDYADPVRGADVARTVEVRPEITTITYSHATFTVRQHILAPLHEPGLLVLLDVDTYRPLDVVVSFQTVLQYAWPGALGGQYGSWDDTAKAFLLSESLRQRNAYIGSPWASGGSSHPAHALPDAPSQFRIPIDPARARREFVPIVIAAGIAPRADVQATYRRLLTGARTLYEEKRAFAERLRRDLLSISTPDKTVDLAFEWAKVNLAEQMVCNPDLGCGLVAGWGPSGRGTRPGFGWFFGGDAAINSFAMSGIGMWDDVAAALRFLAKYQREDGKITHEISQSAGRIPWFSEFPYAYYHADTTPFWLVAVWRYWRASGDTALVRELWPAISKAYTWCTGHDRDGDGLIENTTAGLGAIEVGEIGADIHQDIYLAAVWLESLRAMQALAAAMADPSVAAGAGERFNRGSSTLNDRYWIQAAGHHAFGLLRSGGVNDALTVWPATAASFGLLDATRGRQTMTSIAQPQLTTDWGARMLASDHRLYEPTHYNMGAVWPFVTGFVSLGHYRYGRPWSGFPLVHAIAATTFDWSRGRNPELLSGDYYRPLDTAVPQQFFATSMLVTPLVWGLAGWDADAPAGRARFAPALPADWPLATFAGLPVGDARLVAEVARERFALTIRLSASKGKATVDVAPALPAGATDVRIAVDGRTQGTGNRAPGPQEGAISRRDLATVDVGPTARTIRVAWRGGLEPVPAVTGLHPGQSPLPARLVDFSWNGRAWELTVSGAPGAACEISLVGAPASVLSGAETLDEASGRLRIRVVLPGTGAGWTTARAVIAPR